MNKLYGLIGHPVGHSMSPLMHNDAFQQLGINGYYHAFDVSEESLKEAVTGFRVLGIQGFNVTIPHKVKIMEYLDEIDEEAKMAGAVNTVVNISGRFIGYNTDGRGYLKSLLKLIRFPLQQCNVLIIGAGGAARGVLAAMVNDGVTEITIANRTTSKAETLRDHISNNGCKIKIMSLMEAEQKAGDYDIIINTTSIGMIPNIEDVPMELTNVKQRAIISDLIYNPIKTKWLSQAEEKGLIIHNGIGMFVEQGALAFQKWTGQAPDTKRMTSIVNKQLGGNSC